VAKIKVAFKSIKAEEPDVGYIAELVEADFNESDMKDAGVSPDKTFICVGKNFFDRGVDAVMMGLKYDDPEKFVEKWMKAREWDYIGEEDGFDSLFEELIEDIQSKSRAKIKVKELPQDKESFVKTMAKVLVELYNKGKLIPVYVQSLSDGQYLDSRYRGFEMSLGFWTRGKKCPKTYRTFAKNIWFDPYSENADLSYDY